MRRLVVLLVLPWTVPFALAEESSLPRLLADAQHLNEARAHRIQAEIALQQTIVNARQALLDEGYAAPLEVDVARARLRELVALHSSVHGYQAFLGHLIEACRGQPQPDGDKRQVMIRLPDTLVAQGLLLDVCSVGKRYEELKSLSAQIAAARASAQGHLKAVAAEVAFLQELIRRLHDIHDGSVSLGREIELASMRLAVAETRLAMGQARQQYESCHELLHHDSNRRGFPIQVGGQSVDGPAQLWQLLELQWQICRTEAERARVAVRRDLQSAYQDKLLALSNTGLGRPGEAHLLQAAASDSRRQVGELDQRLAQLHGFRADILRIADARAADDPGRIGMGDGVGGFSDMAAPFSSHRDVSHVRAEITAAQWRITQLTQISPRDEPTTNELTLANAKLATYRAELQFAQDAQTLATLAGQLPRHEPVATMVSVPAPRGAAAGGIVAEHDESILAFFAANAESQGKRAWAKSRSSLAKLKLDHLQELRRLGYAAWKELALAERDLAIARAHELAAEEEQQIARLEYQRVKLAIDTKQRLDPHVAARAR